MNLTGYNSKKDGFTFLEVMVALSVLALILTAVFRLYSQSVSMLVISEFEIKAPLLGKKILNTKKNDPDMSDNEEGDFGKSYPGYKWKLNSTELNIKDMNTDLIESIKNQKFKKVTITITNMDKREYKTFFYAESNE